MDISQKLKLIQEGYSFQDIKAGAVKAFQSIISEDATFSFSKSISSDIKFISESTSILLSENSDSNAFIETIKKIWEWIKRKFFDFISTLKLIYDVTKNEKLDFTELDKYIHNTFKVKVNGYKKILDSNNAADLSGEIKKVMTDIDALYARLLKDNELRIKLNSEMVNVNMENLQEFLIFNALGVHNINQIRFKIFGEGPTEIELDAQAARKAVKNFKDGIDIVDKIANSVKDFIDNMDRKILNFERDLRNKNADISEINASKHAFRTLLTASSSVLIGIFEISRDVVREYERYTHYIAHHFGLIGKQKQE